MKILSIFGTRPEAIKFAPIINLLDKDKRFSSVVCVTGQQREMLDQVLSLFEIKPDYDLRVMRKGQTLSGVVSRILEKISPLLMKEKPDMILVQGDTSSAFAAALASHYCHIPVAHIEAGLRTGDIFAPFPEEANRTLISHLACLHFAPTKLNFQNLLKENIPAKNIVVTGNTVIDALFLAVKMCQLKKQEYWRKRFGSLFQIITGKKPIILVTGHRRESFGKGFLDIIKAIKKISLLHPEIEIIYPVHLNPNVYKPVKEKLSNLANVSLIDPIDYELFVYLMDRSHIILTDSGGIQEEAPSLGKPVLVIRSKTERTEAIAAGTALLVGTNPEKIVQETNRLLKDNKHYQTMSKAQNPYGDGRAAQKIIKALINYYEKN